MSAPVIFHYLSILNIPMLRFKSYLKEAKRAFDDDRIDIFHGTHAEPGSFRSGGIDPTRGAPLSQGQGFYGFGSRREARKYAGAAEKVAKAPNQSSIEQGGKKTSERSSNFIVGTRAHVDHLIPDSELLLKNPKHYEVASKWADEHAAEIEKAIAAHRQSMGEEPREMKVRKPQPTALSPNVDTSTSAIPFTHKPESGRSQIKYGHIAPRFTMEDGKAIPDEGSMGTETLGKVFDILHTHGRPILSKLVKSLHGADRASLALRYVGPVVKDQSNVKIQPVR